MNPKHSPDNHACMIIQEGVYGRALLDVINFNYDS